MSGEPRPIRDGLDRLLRSLGAPSAAAVTLVFEGWADLVGKDIAAHAQPVSLDGSCLVVAVTEPGWATRLNYGQQVVLDRCAAALGPGVVTRLEVRVRPREDGGQRGSQAP